MYSPLHVPDALHKQEPRYPARANPHRRNIAPAKMNQPPLCLCQLQLTANVLSRIASGRYLCVSWGACVWGASTAECGTTMLVFYPGGATAEDDVAKRTVHGLNGKCPRHCRHNHSPRTSAYYRSVGWMYIGRGENREPSTKAQGQQGEVVNVCATRRIGPGI